MTQDDRRIPTEHDAGEMEQVAGELAAEFARDAEREAKRESGLSQGLPPALASRIIASGERMVRRPADAARAGGARVPAGGLASPWPARAGWFLAAAATAAWLLVPSPLRPGNPRVDASVVAVSSPAALRDSVLSAAEVMRLAWGVSSDPAGKEATGEVIWDPGTQRGVMRFAGLAPNDPRIAQYQLWIIDGDRDERYPVDGGVFDVTVDGEVLVPIRARLPVGKPVLFAVTLERPGGVVVSTRERLVLAAG